MREEHFAEAAFDERRTRRLFFAPAVIARGNCGSVHCRGFAAKNAGADVAQRNVLQGPNQFLFPDNQGHERRPGGNDCVTERRRQGITVRLSIP
jgi:hypothetical protein